MIFEVFFLLYFLLRLLHHMYFEESHIFWKDPKNITVLVITMVSDKFSGFCCFLNKTAGQPNALSRGVFPEITQ